MNAPDETASPESPAMPNGSGAAAVLSAGFGAFALALLAVAADKSALIKRSLDFYVPTGPLSGVTTVAVLIWGITWAILEWRWARQDGRHRTHQLRGSRAARHEPVDDISTRRGLVLKVGKRTGRAAPDSKFLRQ